VGGVYGEPKRDMSTGALIPRVATRGRPLLDQIRGLLAGYGYASNETVHDCGELGGLAQTRRRFLLVARHEAKVPPSLYVPRTKPLISVGQLLEKLPLPGDLRAGPMHEIPRLRWPTWVRLAFVEAGKDWRSLERLRVENGYLQDFALERELPDTASAQEGPIVLGDPRIDGHAKSVQLGVQPWTRPSATVTGQMWPGQGPFCIADPRMDRGGRFNNVFRIVRWSDVSPAVTAGGHPTSGGLAVADPRPGLVRKNGDPFATGGHYGVTRWDHPAYTVTAHASCDNGFNSVADPRLPLPTDRLVARIRAMDGTWHRPFSTYELAALQGLVQIDRPYLEMAGRSDTARRERIGNGVPCSAAKAIASTAGMTLLLAWAGETFILTDLSVWVRPIAVALSVSRPERSF
jgi:site-specific DNA-cytosine methylase